MKIEQVKISNFKCLRDISITLGNLTLLTGVNSSGKSSFIQALLLLKQNSENIQSFVTLNSFFKNTKDKKVNANIENIRKDISLFTLGGEYVDLEPGKSLVYQDGFGKPISIELTYPDQYFFKLILNPDFIFTAEHNREVNAEINALLQIFSNFHYIRTDRAIPSITYPLSEQHIRKGYIGLNGEYTAHYLAKNRHTILKMTELKHPDSVTEQLLENVSKWLGEISSGIEVAATVYDQLQMASLTYQYEYGTQTSSKYTPLNVGFGITYVLPVIVAILKSAPGDLLIIENPESHLHPAGQSKIAELCAIAASCGVQIIVETHSDHFLNGVRVATKKQILQPDESRIYYFEKTEGSMEAIAHPLNIDKDGRVDEWPKGFFDEWDNKLNELLW